MRENGMDQSREKEEATWNHLNASGAMDSITTHHN